MQVYSFTCESSLPWMHARKHAHIAFIYIHYFILKGWVFEISIQRSYTNWNTWRSDIAHVYEHVDFKCNHGFKNNKLNKPNILLLWSCLNFGLYDLAVYVYIVTASAYVKIHVIMHISYRRYYPVDIWRRSDIVSTSTLQRRWYDMTLYRRWYAVASTACACWVWFSHLLSWL